MSSLADVWGSEEKYQYTVSSKQTNEDEEELPVQLPTKKIDNTELLKSLQALLLEIHELRREQARRCSTYMIMIGILFGIMILYIDRLNNNISRRQMSHPYA
jgi:hypothetical protein